MDKFIELFNRVKEYFVPEKEDNKKYAFIITANCIKNNNILKLKNEKIVMIEVGKNDRKIILDEEKKGLYEKIGREEITAFLQNGENMSVFDIKNIYFNDHLKIRIDEDKFINYSNNISKVKKLSGQKVMIIINPTIIHKKKYKTNFSKSKKGNKI